MDGEQPANEKRNLGGRPNLGRTPSGLRMREDDKEYLHETARRMGVSSATALARILAVYRELERAIDTSRRPRQKDES